MDLGNGGSGQWGFGKFGKHPFQRCAIGFLQDAPREGAGKRRHPILQPGQLVSHLQRQQVAAGGQCLPQLDRHRPQFFQCQAQTHPEWPFLAPPVPGQRMADPAEGLQRRQVEQGIVQPVTQHHPGGLQDAQRGSEHRQGSFGVQSG